MTRRNFIALVSLFVLVTLGVLGVGIGLFATRSERGQAMTREWIAARIQSSLNGKVRIGRIGGNFLTGITIDSLELRDDEDSLFVATGRVALAYDPRDLVDRRLFFSAVTITHPQVVLRQHEDWKWNYRKLFRITGAPQKKKVGPERGFGDFIVLNNVHIQGGANFRVTIPWHPDDSLHGVKRDSAVAASMARGDHEIRQTREGFTQTYRWTNAYAYLPHMRIADPDTAGQAFVIDTANTEETVPPFKWRNIHGNAHILGDSVWVKADHWDLPGSTGSAEGKVVWGSDLPVRYGIHIYADTASLADVAWVYPTLPTTGGGKMTVDIQNERNLNLLDFVLRDMDVHTTKSRLLGSMTFEIGGPVLSVHDVKVKADPVNFDLLRTLNGKPFPADWQGNLTGTVTARGGPLNHFYVDASNITFRDAHVPTAVSHLQGKGELDILFPAFTAFHNFFVTTDKFDLRTLTAIYPAFPRIKGILSGSAVLDSSWLDVRVSNANLTHTDGPAEPTHATGSGRITYGVQFMAYDLTLQASPLSLTTLAESYPKLPLRGVFSGPLHVRGIAPDLDVSADLAGPAGHLTYNGKADADSIGGYGAKGAGSFDMFNVMTLFGHSKPPMRLAGSYDVDITGDSLSNLVGRVGTRLDSSIVDGVRISRGIAGLRFDRGVLLVDTLRVASDAGVAQARGSLGLTRTPGGDSLAIALDVDSLGGLRRFLATAQTGVAIRKVDSLSGRFTLRGVVHGWLDSLGVRGVLSATDLDVRNERARRLDGTMDILSVGQHMSGDVSLHADGALLAGIALDTAAFSVAVLDAGRGRFAAGGATSGAGRLRTAGEWDIAHDTSTVRLDTVSLALGTSRWELERPSVYRETARGVTVDTLLLADRSGGRITGYLNVPVASEARAHLVADSVTLADIGLLARLPSALTGKLSLELNIAGTREQPVMTLVAKARHFKYAGLFSELVSVNGGYRADRATIDANVQRGGRSLLDANISYPVAVTLFSARATDDSLRGRVRADSIDLALIEGMSPKIRNSSGLVQIDLAISGVPDHPHVGGTAQLSRGTLEVPDVGLRFTSIDGALHVDPVRDSLSIDRLHWISPASNGDASLSGNLVFRDLDNPKFDLRLDARGLRAVDRRGLARFDVSTAPGGLVLKGSTDQATLSGAVDVDHGTIYIPELIRKQVVNLTPEDFAQLYDTSDVHLRSLMPQPPSLLVEHLQLNGVSVRLGEDVWLRSREASIKLGGSLVVQRARVEGKATRSELASGRPDTARYQLALSGDLTADRGTYTLDLVAVQREFQVQSGKISFFGTPDFNPQIDVNTIYRVKQANRGDIDITAGIHGKFYPQPLLTLSSNDSYLSQSDLVSYLVTGQPISELSSKDLSASQRAFEFLLPTLGASVGRALRGPLGGVADNIQIQSGAVVNDPLNSSTQFRSILQSTRLGGEKQITSKLFLSFSTGLCQLGSTGDDTSQQGFTGFANAIEGKLEYRFPLPAPERFSLRAGREPPASALRCGATNQVRGFVSTPQQWGLSLFRSWSF